MDVWGVQWNEGGSIRGTSSPEVMLGGESPPLITEKMAAPVDRKLFPPVHTGGPLTYDGTSSTVFRGIISHTELPPTTGVTNPRTLTKNTNSSLLRKRLHMNELAPPVNERSSRSKLTRLWVQFTD